MTLQRNNINLNPVEVTDSQHYTLINHFLTTGEYLTVLTAIRAYGIYALSQRVGELKRMGFPIQDQWTVLKNGKRVKAYYI
jgi:hypothetical protein